MAEQIKIIGTKDLKGRLLLGAIMLVALIFAWFALSWQIANMLASATQPTDPNAKEIADFSYNLSSRDPMTNWLKGNIEKDTFLPNSLPNATADLENAVRCAPADYRYWIELGRNYEQLEEYDKAEAIFLYAVKIAPNYSFIHWQLGNFYLRRGREAEAFAELRKSAGNSSVYSDQIFSIVWEYYDKDKTKLEQLAGEKGDIRASLARFYAAKGESEDSLRIWNTISEADKQRNEQTARIITQSLYERRFYRAANAFTRQLGLEPDAQIGTIENGGFEEPLAPNGNDTYFGWKIGKKEKMEINTDPIKRKEGGKSLRVSFNGFTSLELKNIGQIVAVESGKKYRLSFWLKTDNLKSAGNPTLEIINANDEKIITTSAAFASGTNDWTQLKIEFTTPPNAEAVAVRFDRAYCGDACPIVGTFWVDEFKLETL